MLKNKTLELLLLAGGIIIGSLPSAGFAQTPPPQAEGYNSPETKTTKPMIFSPKGESLILKAQSPLVAPHVYHPFHISTPFSQVDPITGAVSCSENGHALIDGYLYEGQRGGDRQFELIVGLDSSLIYGPNSSGIAQLEVVLCSRTPTSISEEISELNVNEYDRRITYTDVGQLQLDEDMFSDQIEKFPDLVFKILKVSSTEKGFTKSLFDLGGNIAKNEQKEADLAKANEIIGDRAYGVWYTYRGKGEGIFDEDIGAKQYARGVHRASKVVGLHFKEGGKNTEAVIIRIKRFDYTHGTPSRLTYIASAAFAFNVEQAFAKWSVVK